MKIFTLFALVLSLGISNGFGKVYPGLKVKGDFRKLDLVVETIRPNKFVTDQDITNTVKLRLFSNNIKIQDYGSEYLYVNVNILDLEDGVNFIFNIKINLDKRSLNYGVSPLFVGTTFVPHQGTYAMLGVNFSKDALLSSIQGQIDKFLVDYIESNMED